MDRKNGMTVHTVGGDRSYCRAADSEIGASPRLCANCPLCGGETGECVYDDADNSVFPGFIGNGRWTDRYGTFERALQYAAVAHKGSFRKGTDIPYIVHPMEAAMIASTVTDDVDVIAAAALHDVVEDTDRTADDIMREFGPRIAGIVCHESEDKHPEMPPSESWEMRKREFLESLEDAPYEAKVVALADKLSNMRSMAEDHARLGDSMWEKFNQRDVSKQAWYYCSISEILKADLGETDAWKEYDGLCKRVFNKH